MLSRILSYFYSAISLFSLIFTTYTLYSHYIASETSDIYTKNIHSHYCDMAALPVTKIKTDNRYEKLILLDLIINNARTNQHLSYLLKHLHFIGINPKDVQHLAERVKRTHFQSIEDITRSLLNSKDIARKDLKDFKTICSGIYDFYFSRNYRDIVRLWKFTYKNEIMRLEKSYPIIMSSFIKKIEECLYIESLICRMLDLS